MKDINDIKIEIEVGRKVDEMEVLLNQQIEENDFNIIRETFCQILYIAFQIRQLFKLSSVVKENYEILVDGFSDLSCKVYSQAITRKYEVAK